MIDKIPGWARPAVDQFLKTGQLAGTTRQSSQPETLNTMISDRFAEARKLDDAPVDYAPGKGKLLTGGVFGPIHTDYNDTQLVKSNPNMAIYAEDDGRVARQVVVTRVEGFYETFASYLDRSDPDNGYLLSQG